VSISRPTSSQGPNKFAALIYTYYLLYVQILGKQDIFKNNFNKAKKKKIKDIPVTGHRGP
jgi:hypothetical protein